MTPASRMMIPSFMSFHLSNTEEVEHFKHLFGAQVAEPRKKVAILLLILLVDVIISGKSNVFVHVHEIIKTHAVDPASKFLKLSGGEFGLHIFFSFCLIITDIKI